ncbi:hypothetical protein THTE_3611 [Thermogutta terrifontis]|uniref:Uncharacterized protein n=1 Tax=Thermogutta terrifontis TaxID=1331910 RepID=A0A286RJX1_9BACT|nr:hypothetical protein THTE_3611 [Thermogutta terrifontis]
MRARGPIQNLERFAPGNFVAGAFFPCRWDKSICGSRRRVSSTVVIQIP